MIHLLDIRFLGFKNETNENKKRLSAFFIRNSPNTINGGLLNTEQIKSLP